MNWSDIEYFTPAEFICQCGKCSGSTPGGVADLMDIDFVVKLDSLRRLLGFPMGITSGYRCPDHNAAVSSTGPNGPHTTGGAADLSLDRARAFQVMGHVEALGFNGLGINQKGNGRFIHLDNVHDDFSIWSY